MTLPSGDDRPVDEPTLVARARAGDREAFGELVVAHQARAYRLAWRLTRDRQIAEELTQEAFLRAFSHLENFREGEPFRRWLVTIVMNLCLNEIKRKKRAAIPVDDRTVARIEGQALAGGRAGETVDAQVATRELERDLDREVANLPPKYRAAFLLRHNEQLSVQEIAGALGVPEGTVKTLLFRARELLRARLSRHLAG
ncbi:MAG: sigma-70 family RNA polymerase sigma factor [Candidatus Riflebacteria bacterium]|nr:sigma-70 family RNA polymerase sigma factor [Candidatus Riflebacteria bacterium]